MAGLLARLRALIPGTAPTDGEDPVAALTMAYQQWLAQLHGLRVELGQVAAARRRLDVATRQQPAAASASPSAVARDEALAVEQRALSQVVAALRDQLEGFRAERDAIAAEPDPAEAGRRARAALLRWQTATEQALQAAATPAESSGNPWHDPLAAEPSGVVPDTEGVPLRYEQPPRDSGGHATPVDGSHPLYPDPLYPDPLYPVPLAPEPSADGGQQ